MLFSEAYEMRDAEVCARERGLVCVYPKPNQLFIDIDSEEAFGTFKEQLEILDQSGVIMLWREAPSKSGLPRRHITVTLRRDVDNRERIALQLALGSDRRREALSLLRVYKNPGKPPTVFFELPPDGVVVAPTQIERSSLDEYLADGSWS